MKKIIFIILTTLLFYTRFVNLGWGLPYPMHPDESNMAAAVQNLSCEIRNWKLEIRNCYNPHFFAYGQFPLYGGYIGVLLMKFFDGDLGTAISFQEAVLSLRVISAVSSVITVFILLKILGLLGVLGRFGKKNVALYSLFIILFTFSPVLIQFAHFGTTESLLILFYSLIIYYSLLFLQKKLLPTPYSLLTFLICGLAIATKVSSVVFLALPIFTVITCDVRSYNRLSMLVRYILLTAITAIIFSPHNLISFGEFISSIQYESAVATGNILAFYTRQFDHTVPILFQVTKIFPYALGWPVYILGLLGLLGILGISWRKKEYNLLRFAFFLAFLPNAFMYAKWTRFMAPVFPILLIFAMLFLMEIKVMKIIKITIIVVAVLPGIAYLSVYRNPDVRFQASEWIYKNIPSGSTILSETANVIDLPIAVRSEKLGVRSYNIYSFNFYDLDQEKNLQQELMYLVQNADYILVPSRRIFKNHPKQVYPLLNTYYLKLFSGELGFKQIAEFNSYPKLNFQFSVFSFQFETPDEDAEETWTVFDHPVVRIYKKMRS